MTNEIFCIEEPIQSHCLYIKVSVWFWIMPFTVRPVKDWKSVQKQKSLLIGPPLPAVQGSSVHASELRTVIFFFFNKRKTTMILEKSCSILTWEQKRTERIIIIYLRCTEHVSMATKQWLHRPVLKLWLFAMWCVGLDIKYPPLLSSSWSSSSLKKRIVRMRICKIQCFRWW